MSRESSRTFYFNSIVKYSDLNIRRNIIIPMKYRVSNYLVERFLRITYFLQPRWTNFLNSLNNLLYPVDRIIDYIIYWPLNCFGVGREKISLRVFLRLIPENFNG